MKVRKVFALLLCCSIYSVAIGQTITVDLQLPDLKEVQTKLNGFNTGPAMNEIFEATANPVDIVNNCAVLPAPFNTIKDWQITSMNPKADFANKTAELKPGTLRFPGGTIANYYHLYKYENGVYDPEDPQYAPGCGTVRVETQAYPNGNTIGKQYCNLDNRVNLEDEEDNPNNINGFANLVKVIEGKNHMPHDSSYKVDVIYVANLLTHFQFKFGNNTLRQEELSPSDPDNILNVADPNSLFELYYKETEDAVAYLIERGINVVGVELSNEVYFAVYRNNNNNVSAEKYMKLGEIYAARLKNTFPEMKIAVATEAANKPWNTALAEYTPAFYDAIVLHNYYNETTCINPNETCGTECSSNVLNDRDCRFDCGKCALGDYVKSDLIGVFEEAIEAFPEDKKIWMTEWGIISPNGQGSNLDFLNTFLYSSFTLEHLLQQFEFNALHGNKIEYSTHHRLGFKINWSVVQQDIKNEEAMIRSNFYSFKFLNDIFFNDNVHLDNSLEILDLEDPTDVFAKSIVTRDENADLLVNICYSNKTAQEVPVSLRNNNEVFIMDEYFEVKPEVTASYLKGNALSASFGITQFKGEKTDESDNPSLQVVENEVSDTSSIVLPAYSTGVFTVRLDNLITSLDEQDHDRSPISIYPNPSEGVLNILSHSQEVNQVTVFDTRGQLMLTRKVSSDSNQKIDLSGLEQGTYFINVSGPELSQVQKIVKID